MAWLVVVIKSAKNDSIRMWKARIKLKKMIEVSTQPSGVVVVRVDAKSPVAAAAMANRSVDLIDNLGPSNAGTTEKFAVVAAVVDRVVNESEKDQEAALRKASRPR